MSCRAIPAPAPATVSELHRLYLADRLSAAEVQANPYLYGTAREIAAEARQLIAERGSVEIADLGGTQGKHRRIVAFALAVLAAKGEIVADPADHRRWLAA